LSIKLEIENFKSIQKLKLDLSDLTILIGPPASGKSNILDALALMGYINRFRVLDREYKHDENIKELKHGDLNEICKKIEEITKEKLNKVINNITNKLSEFVK
jgi:AAA15 family ATPase/GTPase